MTNIITGKHITFFATQAGYNIVIHVHYLRGYRAFLPATSVDHELAAVGDQLSRYENARPHSSLGYRPPAPEAIEPLPLGSATLRLSATAGHGILIQDLVPLMGAGHRVHSKAGGLGRLTVSRGSARPRSCSSRTWSGRCRHRAQRRTGVRTRPNTTAPRFPRTRTRPAHTCDPRPRSGRCRG